MNKIIILLIIAFTAFSCGSKDNKMQTQENKQQSTQETKKDSSTDKTKTGDLKVKSSAFTDEGMIPKKFACNGDDVSPEVSWDGAPAGTKSFALIVDDPDAPSGDHVHWVVYNIPPDVKELTEAAPNDTKLSNGALQGTNGSEKTGYSGPCPPSGTHRYYFKVYALDNMLKQSVYVTKDILLNSMKGHILAQGQLMGKYSK